VKKLVSLITENIFMKVAILISHPIQYHSPFFKFIKKNSALDLTVFYGWDFGIKPTYDREFKKTFEWNVPLIEGYESFFLKNISLRASSDFWGQINPGIIPALIKGNFDALIIYGWNGVTHLLAILTAKLLGLPIFLRGENPFIHEANIKGIKRFLKKTLLGSLFKLVNGFLYIGTENKQFYQHFGAKEEKMFFMPYAFDEERFVNVRNSLRTKRSELRGRLGFSENEYIVLVVGKLIQKKRPLDAIKAVEKMTFTNCKLVFVGSGELEEELRAYVSNNNVQNIEFAGFKNQDEILEYFVSADTLLLCSEYGETWGFVVNEAMFFGLPVVVSSLVGCAPDLVRGGENGFIYEVGDIGECASRLDELARDKEKRLKFGKKSEEIVKQYSYAEDLRGIEAALMYVSKRV